MQPVELLQVSMVQGFPSSHCVFTMVHPFTGSHTVLKHLLSMLVSQTSGLSWQTPSKMPQDDIVQASGAVHPLQQVCPLPPQTLQ